MNGNEWFIDAEIHEQHAMKLHRNEENKYHKQEPTEKSEEGMGGSWWWKKQDNKILFNRCLHHNFYWLDQEYLSLIMVVAVMSSIRCILYVFYFSCRYKLDLDH